MSEQLFADLHIHTYFSDGTLSPEETIEEAHRHGLKCIAVTDHDTLDGIAPTIEAAKKYGIEVISGVEISTQINGRDIHILAYLFDHNDKEFQTKLRSMQDSRVPRMREMIEKLNGLGICDISLEEICAKTQSNSVGRLHLAQALVAKNHVKNVKEAFDKYLADDKPAYVGKQKLSPEDAFAMIKRAGGVSVMAHPMMTGADELIPRFVSAGLDGLEVFYPHIMEKIIEYYKKLAVKHNLVLTGGSDAHGAAKQHTYIGKVKVPYEIVERLKEYHAASQAKK